MTRTIASILNLMALACYIIAVVLVVRDLIKPSVVVLIVGQFIEFFIRYVRTDLE